MLASPLKCVFEPSKDSKNRSQKLSMLEKKGQFWNLHQIPLKTSNPDFSIFILF